MEDCQANDSSDEFEVIEMFRVDAGVRVDLEGIIVVSRIFKKTVERIEHLMGQKEEELSAKQSDQVLTQRRQTHLDKPP